MPATPTLRRLFACLKSCDCVTAWSHSDLTREIRSWIESAAWAPAGPDRVSSVFRRTHCCGGSGAAGRTGDCNAICDMALSFQSESVRSVGGPAAVDREGDSGDRCSGGAPKATSETTQLLGGCAPL